MKHQNRKYALIVSVVTALLVTVSAMLPAASSRSMQEPVRAPLAATPVATITAAP